MHHKLVIGAAALLSLFSAGTGAAQDGIDPRMAAVDEVIAYRRLVMADTLTFDACLLFKATRESEDFPRGIGDANRGALDRLDPRPCDAADAPARFPRRVYVDSIVLMDSIGSVYLTVRRGEWLHRETFTLARISAGEWSTRDVRIWGAIQVAPPPPRPSGTR